MLLSLLLVAFTCEGLAGLATFEVPNLGGKRTFKSIVLVRACGALFSSFLLQSYRAAEADGRASEAGGRAAR